MKYLIYAGLITIFLTGCADDEGAELVQGNVQLSGVLSESAASSNKIVSRSASNGICDAGSNTCTPNNLQGRIFSGGAMLGELGPGAFNVTMIGANEDIILNPSEGLGGEIEFSLIDNTKFSSLYAAPFSEDMPSNPIVTRMEFNYDYLDAQFTLSGTADSQNMDTAFIIRTVFSETASAADVTGTMRLGDKLIKSSDETNFSWCNDSSCSETRSDVVTDLVTEDKLVNYIYPGDGNPKYVPFTVPVSNNLMISYSELTTVGSWWEVTFDMTNAILFSVNPENINNRSELLEAFELSYEPDQQNAGQQTEISLALFFSSTEPNVTP